MITRRKKLSDLNILLSASVALLTLTTTAWAGGKGRPVDSSYEGKRPLIESHQASLTRSYRNAYQSYDKSSEEFQKSIAQYQSDLNRARAAQADAERTYWEYENARKQAIGDLDVTGEQLKTLKKKVYEDGTPASKSELQALEAREKDQFKKVEELAKNAESLKAEYWRANQAAESLQKEISEKSEKELGTRIDFTGQDPSRSLEAIARRGKLDAVDRITGQFLDSVKHDYLKSGLLVADLATLQSKHELTAEQLQALERELGGRLDNTLLGRYIDQKVNSCELLNKMAACNASGMNSAATSTAAPSGGDSPQAASKFEVSKPTGLTNRESSKLPLGQKKALTAE